jgi:hypothetical protein
MKLSPPETRLLKLSFFALFLALLLAPAADAQSRKKGDAAKSKPLAKSPAATSKDARKQSAKATSSKQSNNKDSKTSANKAERNRKDAKNTSAQRREASSTKTSKNSARNERDRGRSSKTVAKDDRNQRKDSKKLTPAERRAEERRRKAEEARRLAAIEEQRRREEAARIARERKLAFERSLKTQTAENIQNDSIEGEDPEIRRAAIEALGERAGTVVVMEAKTGKILTIVNQDWAIRNSFKPCSTIKLVTGVSGLNENVINSDGGIGETSSRMNLDLALAKSDNGYFQRVGAAVGNAKMLAYARSLGLGQPTGINVPGETAGKLPFGNNNLRIYSHGDDFEVTPLQLAVMVSAIANEGKKVVPQIVKGKSRFTPKFGESVPISYRTVQSLLPGMIGAAEYGTAHRNMDQSLGVAGKTGSCIFNGSWIGLFASVAPVEDPQYSVVVITRGEGERGRTAASVAAQIYRSLAPRLKRNIDKYMALKALRPAPSAEILAAASDEEEDESAQELANGESRPVIVAGSAPQTVQKKVQKTTQSKPVFPPVVIEYDKDKSTDKNVPSRPRVIKN